MASAAALLDDADWEYPTSRKHQPYMVNFMSFVQGRLDDPLPKDSVFSKEELLAITPSLIRQWLNFRSYGDPFPGPNDPATHCRASSLRKAKAGVSHFMPNRHADWLEGIGGNPTRHRSVTDLIRRVERKEIRGQGVKANDKRPYRKAEFMKVLDLFRSAPGFDNQCKYPMMTLWSYHLIHRLDDTCHFKVSAPHGCVEHPFAIKTKTKWSKNVVNFHNCPDQILFGAKDSKVCPQLWLAVYLDQWLSRHPNAVHLFTANDDAERGPDNVKQQYANRVEAVCWKHPDFQALEDEVGDDPRGIGTHSLRKYGVNEAKSQGAVTEQYEYRGRWIGKKTGSVAERHYAEADDPFTDAMVAGMLCHGGPIRYALRDNLAAVTDNFLFTTVIPHIRDRFANHDIRFCRVMALAKLYAVFDDEISELLPMEDMLTIRQAFEEAYGTQETNPVQQIEIVIMRIDGRLEIVDSARPDGNGGVGVGAPAAVQQNGALSNDAQQVLSYIKAMEQNIQQQLTNIQAQQEQLRVWMQAQFNKVNNNQRRFGGTIGQALARQDPDEQARRRQDAAEEAQQRYRAANPYATTQQVAAAGARAANAAFNARGRAGDPMARLMERPKSLFELHEEYIHGHGQNKPAKSFTTEERNSRVDGIKQKYYRRMKVWKLQTYLINGGYTIHAANAKIQAVYQTDKVTQIIDKIIRDSKVPANPMVAAVGFRINPQLRVNAF